MPRYELHTADSVDTSHGVLRFLRHEPPGFATEPRPLVLFLHGAGERGDDLARVCDQGLPRAIERGRNVPFVTVAPQCPAEASWNDLTPLLHELLDQVVAPLRIDPRRVYLTGISMGGFGAFKLASERPERFAALVPICGGGNPAWAPRLARLPTWAFHGQDDRVVPASTSETMVDALRATGAPVRLTIYEGVGHDAWTRAYDEPELFSWLLSQQRSAPA